MNEPHEIIKPTFRSQRNLTNTQISKPQALYQEAQKLEATWTSGLFFSLLTKKLEEISRNDLVIQRFYHTPLYEAAESQTLLQCKGRIKLECIKTFFSLMIENNFIHKKKWNKSQHAACLIHKNLKFERATKSKKEDKGCFLTHSSSFFFFLFN